MGIEYNIILSIEGKQRILKKFKKKAKSNDRILDFNKFIPNPNKNMEWYDNILDLGCLLFPEPIGFEEKRDWRQKNWGTSSNAINAYIWNFEEEDDELYYSFDLNNGIAYPVIIEMSKQFPTLEFTIFYVDDFDCGGDDFYDEEYGVIVIENGLEILDEYYTHFDLIKAEFECQSEKDWRKYLDIELRGEIY